MTVSVEGKAECGGNPPSAATSQPVSQRARRRASDKMGSSTIIHGEAKGCQRLIVAPSRFGALFATLLLLCLLQHLVRHRI